MKILIYTFIAFMLLGTVAAFADDNVCLGNHTADELIQQFKTQNTTPYTLVDPEALKALSEASVLMGGEPLPDNIAELIFRDQSVNPTSGPAVMVGGFTNKGCYAGSMAIPKELLNGIVKAEEAKKAAHQS